MQERKAVARVIERMRLYHEKASGSQPDAKTARVMEEKIKSAALASDNRKKRK